MDIPHDMVKVTYRHSGELWLLVQRLNAIGRVFIVNPATSQIALSQDAVAELTQEGLFI